MINRKVIAVFAIIFSLGLIWVGRQLRKVVDRTQSFETFLPSNMPQHYTFPPEAVMTNLEIHGRKVMGNVPADPQGHRKLVIMNKVSPDWKQGMERSFKAQAGEGLKEVHIDKKDSFIWSVDGQALNVESVRVTLKNDRNEVTKFDAMVDSESGKILQTWNQPVIDPLNPREAQGVRVDPRFLQD